jgi:ubiquinone biosynthesis protein UbiJ
MADILVEDTISDMGHSLSSFPKHKLKQLVTQLAQEIGDEERSDIFKSNTAHLIR